MEKILVTLDEGAYTVLNGGYTITLSGLSATTEIEHLAYIYNITQKKLYYNPSGDGAKSLANATLSGNVITIDSTAFSALATGDKIHLQIFVKNTDPRDVFITNQDSEKYTSVEVLIDESNLGLDGIYDGGGTQDLVFTDSGETYTAEDVAEGYKIHNVTQALSAIITADTLSGLAGDGGAGNPTADDITHAAMGSDWVDTNVASIPEVKRFVYGMDGYSETHIQVELDSQDANNVCYCDLYATLNENADADDDVYWEKISDDAFGGTLEADGITAGARAVTTHYAIVDGGFKKLMVKIVAENDDGTQDNEFEIRIKKLYN